LVSGVTRTYKWLRNQRVFGILVTTLVIIFIGATALFFAEGYYGRKGLGGDFGCRVVGRCHGHDGGIR
jgi:hypothetical protein